MSDDAVRNPSHYAGDGVTDCMTAMRSMVSGAECTPMYAFAWCNALKYLWRHWRKGGTEDLEKCKEYIDIMIGGGR